MEEDKYVYAGINKVLLGKYLFTKEAGNALDSYGVDIKDKLSKVLGVGLPLLGGLGGAYSAGKKGTNPIAGALKWGLPGLALGMLFKGMGPSEEDKRLSTMGGMKPISDALGLGKSLANYPKQDIQKGFSDLSSRSGELDTLNRDLMKLKQEMMAEKNPLNRARMAHDVSKKDWDLQKIKQQIKNYGKNVSGELSLLHELSGNV